MDTTLLICLLTTFFVVVLTNSSLIREKCQDTQCVGHYKLTHSKELHVNLTSLKSKGIVKVFPKLLDAFLFSRERYTSYCYQGGNIDPNTGCEVHEERVFPSIKELKTWVANNGCKTGKVCCPSSDCWGSGSDACLSPMKDEITEKYYSNKEFDCTHTSWMVFPHHSCVIDWKCQFQKIKLPLHTCPSHQTMKICTSAPNGTELEIPESLGTYFQIWEIDKYTKMGVESRNLFRLAPEAIECELECYQRSKGALLPELCIMSSNCGQGRQILRLAEGTTFLCSRYACTDGSTINKNHVNIPFYNQSAPTVSSNQGKHPDEMASKEDLSVVMDYMSAEVMRIDMNTINLTEHVGQMEKRLINLVNYLSQSDKLLFGKVMERSVLVKYMNNEQFTICPCTLEEISEEKICRKGDGYQFRLGSVWKWDGTSECLRPSKNSTPVQLISDVNFRKDDYEEPDIVGASFEWDGWQFVGRYRDSLIETMNTNYGFRNSVLYPNIDSSLFNPVALFTSFVSSYVSWIALGLSIINFLRR